MKTLVQCLRHRCRMKHTTTTTLPHKVSRAITTNKNTSNFATPVFTWHVVVEDCCIVVNIVVIVVFRGEVGERGVDVVLSEKDIVEMVTILFFTPSLLQNENFVHFLPLHHMKWNEMDKWNGYMKWINQTNWNSSKVGKVLKVRPMALCHVISEEMKWINEMDILNRWFKLIDQMDESDGLMR